MPYHYSEESVGNFWHVGQGTCDLCIGWGLFPRQPTAPQSFPSKSCCHPLLPRGSSVFFQHLSQLLPRSHCVLCGASFTLSCSLSSRLVRLKEKRSSVWSGTGCLGGFAQGWHAALDAQVRLKDLQVQSTAGWEAEAGWGESTTQQRAGQWTA